MIFAEGDHALEEAEDLLICGELAPVQPSRSVVLVVGIVVAELGVQELISGSEHRNAIRQHQQAAEILYLLLAQRQHFRRRSYFPFVPAVPTVVLVRAVLIVIAIGGVAFLVVGNQVVESEAVVRSYEVNALVGVICVSASVGKKVVAAIDTPHQVWDHSRIAFNKAANVVAKAAVPLQPRLAWESAAELKRSGIPRLCDQP